MAPALNIIIFLCLAIATFWLVSQQFVYVFTQNITNWIIGTSSTNGVPNLRGLLLHGFVLALIILLLSLILL